MSVFTGALPTVTPAVDSWGAQLNNRLTDLDAAFGKGSGVPVNQAGFGYVANDPSTHVPAWNAAQTYALANGKTGIVLPEGTLTGTPDVNGVLFPIQSGIKWVRGAGRDASTLKVAAGCGDYLAVLKPSGDASGLVISDLTVDQNNTGNPITTGVTLTDPLFVNKSRFCVSVTVPASRVTITRVRCKDMDNVNAVSVTGAVRDTVVEDVAFEMGSAANDHDHSAIYLNPSGVGSAVWVNRCTADAYGSVAGTNAARTFIETHAGYQVITGNVSRGYQKGANITGIQNYPGEGSRVLFNKFLDAKFGVQLWSGAYGANTPGTVGMKFCQVAHNLITLDVAGWAAVFAGSGWCNGLFIDATAGLPFEDVDVEHNHIQFKNGGHVGLAGDTVANGIDWRRNPIGTVIDKRVHIRHNTVEGAGASGIRVAVNGTGFDVSHNTIRNPGQASVAAGGAMSNGSANGVMVSGALTYSRVNFNDVLDDQGTPTTNDGLYLVGSAACTASEAMFNRIPVANSKKVETGATFGGWLIRMDMSGFVSPGGLAAYGSEINDRTNGVLYRQATAPEGSTWTGDPYLLKGQGQPGVQASTQFYASTGGHSSAAATDGTVTATPIWLGGGKTFTSMGVSVTVAGATGSVIRLGVYADANGTPGARVLDAGTVASDTTGVKTVTVSWAPVAGRYWLAGAAQGGVAAPTTVTLASTYTTDLGVGSMANLLLTAPRVGCTMTGVAGALPASFTRAGDSGAPILVGIGA